MAKVLRRGGRVMLAEALAKVGRVCEPGGMGDFLDAHGVLGEQPSGLFEPYLKDVTRRGHACGGAEEVGVIGACETMDGSELRDIWCIGQVG